MMNDNRGKIIIYIETKSKCKTGCEIMRYKSLLKYVGLVLFCIFGYFLYMNQLGAIPLLIISILLFYLGCRDIKRSNE